MSPPLRVLPVEDNPQNRKLLERVAAAAGWELEDHGDAEAALERLAAGPAPDLVLMDLALPGLDGYEATRRIRSDPALAWLPVVALTAHAMVGDEARAREVGCDAYLTKPIDVRAFPEAMRALLEELAPRRSLRRLQGIRRALEEVAGTGGDAALLERLRAATTALRRELSGG